MSSPQPETRARSLGQEVVEQIKAVCRMCHGGCGTIVERVNGTIRKVIGDRDNPINRGALCSKRAPPRWSSSIIPAASIIR